MSEAGYMNFFNVDRCGLYKLGNKTPQGVELKETFDLIMEWVDGRSFRATIPWDPATAKRNRPNCYCKDIYKNEETGDFLLVLWKSDSDSAGTLWGAPEDNETGRGTVVKYTNEYKGKKVVWGRPCYYWVIPEFNTIVSIRFDHSVCDAQLFEDYVTSCINNRVSHKNRKKEHTEKGFVRISHEDDEKNLFMYSFRMSLKSLNTVSSELKELVKKVTHIIRRETIIVDSKDERTEWVKRFTSHIPFVAAKPKSKQRKIEISAEARPTESEIKEIIENNAKEGRKSSDWDNVGFQTEDGIRWVDKYRLKDYIICSSNGDSIFSAEYLLEKITEQRSKFVRPLILDLNNLPKEQLEKSEEAII